MNLNVLKGLLIILVVVDHNDFSRQLIPGFLYGLTFHVVGFMTIPFLRPAHQLGSREFGDYVFRLYYPFLLVTCALWAVVTVTGTVPLAERLAALGLVLYSGNAELLKATVNMGLLWFLPSFIALVALRAAMESGGPVLKAAVLALLIALHPVIGTVARSVENYLPLGLLPALYIIPLAYAGVYLHRKLFEPLPVAPAVLVSLAAYVAVKAVQMSLALSNEVGFSAVADYTEPLALLVNDLEAVAGTLMLFQLARVRVGAIFALFAMVEPCGKYSMQMYLFHAFVALGLYKALLLLVPGAPPLYLFVGSLLATIVITLGGAAIVMRTAWLKRMIFPRNVHELVRGAGPVREDEKNAVQSRD